jgi:hypothetical protein
MSKRFFSITNTNSTWSEAPLPAFCRRIRLPGLGRDEDYYWFALVGDMEDRICRRFNPGDFEGLVRHTEMSVSPRAELAKPQILSTSSEGRGRTTFSSRVGLSRLWISILRDWG